MWICGCQGQWKWKFEKKKTVKSQVKLKLLPSGTNEGSSHSWKILPQSLSVLNLLWACCSADCVFWLPGLGIQMFFSDIGRNNSLWRRRLLHTVSGMWVYFSKKYSSPVFCFQHSLHSSIDGGWRISSPATTVRKQNVLWCYCPAGPSWAISMHNRHTPVNRSRLEVKGEWS